MTPLEEADAENRSLRLQVAKLKLQRNHWKREALAYFARLAPLIGNQPAKDPVRDEKAKQLDEDRETIGQAIARRTPAGDKEYEKRLWDYAEKEIAARGVGHGEEIAADILSGDAGDRFAEELEETVE